MDLMATKMSLQSKKELLENLKIKYKESTWKDKCKIIDGFITATGYHRKYATTILNSNPIINNKKIIKRKRKVKYDSFVQEALVTLWNAANQICAKRLIPFLPELIKVLERHKYLNLSREVKNKLLTISAATADRILKKERIKYNKGISTTKPGNLLKKQIQIRTFADWDDVVPGFMEVDLVAHCGGNISGRYLHTLVLTDIATGWTECLAVLNKSSYDVITALKITQKILPFKLMGLDTDNGREFINYDLFDYCKAEKITFTRSRPYKKNDQAHVEEKNGSIVRRIVGYDRYESFESWRALTDLYSVLRLYTNFFQPSMKLISKKRDGSKVTKKYDVAKTPYQRLLNSDKISDKNKLKLKIKYEKLDPIKLLKRVVKCQLKFWKLAWNKQCEKNNENEKSYDDMIKDLTIGKYRKTKKPRKKMAPRWWRSRKDPFEEVWPQLQLKLQLNPQVTANTLL